MLLAVAILFGGSACADEAPAPSGHAYSLGECLALTEKNHPSLFAARARLEAMRAQLEEARVAPASFVSMKSKFGLTPNVPAAGVPSGTDIVSQGLSAGFGPFVQLGIDATVPLFTFGKISSAQHAAEAQVRLGEWDVEKEKQQVRTDVRRAFWGVALARDLEHLAKDALTKLDDAIAAVQKKLDEADPTVDRVDRLRLEVTRDDLVARLGEAKRTHDAAFAALRFYTGVQEGFDVADEPLVRPPASLAPVVQYLSAARIHRADVNRARAGVVARAAQVEQARANMLPSFGLGVSLDVARAPGVEGSFSGYDPAAANHTNFLAGLGMEWSLDLLTKNARRKQAEANLEEARAIERLALGGVGAEVEAAYAAAVEAQTREQTWDAAVRRAKSWVVAVEDAIDLGTKDERALVEPLQRFMLARAAQLQALMDAWMTRAELARVTGWDPAAS